MRVCAVRGVFEAAINHCMRAMCVNNVDDVQHWFHTASYAEVLDGVVVVRAHARAADEAVCVDMFMLRSFDARYAALRLISLYTYIVLLKIIFRRAAVVYEHMLTM